MDRVAQYRQIIRQCLEDFASYDPNAQLIFDPERDRYLVMHNEWRNDYRLYGCAIQLDLIDAKVWIQHNSTKLYIDRELIQQGVAPGDIVFGFRAPSIRERFTEALTSL